MANICCETLSSKKVIKCLGFLPVLFCLSLLGWSYYAFMFTLCIPVLLKHLPVMGWTMLALVQPAFILAIWSYLGAVFINPGIPRQELAQGKSEETAADWQIAQAAARAEEEEDEEGQNVGDSTPLRGTSPVKPLEDRPTDGNLFPTITVKRDGSARYCKKCQFYKPDRTHHCRVCQECVLKMDHHCPWINGCVGHYNQKHFYLFLFWTCVYCVMNFVSVMPPLYKSLHDQAEYTADIQWLFLALASGMFGFSLIGFMSFHTWLLLKNMTTIESFGRQRLRSEMGSDQRHVFDLGFRKNIEQVLGPDPRLWLLPVRSTPGNGLRYPTCVPQDMAMEEGRTCSV